MGNELDVEFIMSERNPSFKFQLYTESNRPRNTVCPILLVAIPDLESRPRMKSNRGRFVVACQMLGRKSRLMVAPQN